MPFFENAKNPHRPRDILNIDLAHIFEVQVELVSNLVPCCSGETDAAWLGEGFKARRHIDAIAQHVVALGNDIADVDPDAELDLSPWIDVDIAFSHTRLYGERAPHGLDRARELQ